MSNEQADWEALWARSQVDQESLLDEERTPRWKQIEGFVQRRYGSFEGLRVIEIGSGHGTNAIHFARRGAEASVLDSSGNALEGAVRSANALQTRVEPVLGDVFDPPAQLLGSFDIACSFGLCEHFLGDERQQVVAAHLSFLRPDGAAVIGVPNRRAFPYRAWMSFLKWRGHWLLGIEEPFDADELKLRVRRAGGRVLHVGYGSFAATFVGYCVNPVLHNGGRKGFRRPQFTTPFDPLAYELVVFAEHDRSKAG
jgi:SAM-dependent methyltransferase